MNSKEQKIKDTYENLGFNWIQIKNLVTENGVLILPSPDLKYTLQGYDNLISDKDHFVSFGSSGLKLQPSSLKGIYNNNGWIKIESEDDLPKETDTYWFMSRFTGKVMKDYFTCDSKALAFHSAQFKLYSHYQPIEKPKLPLH